jgi:hypothetical protein
MICSLIRSDQSGDGDRNIKDARRSLQRGQNPRSRTDGDNISVTEGRKRRQAEIQQLAAVGYLLCGFDSLRELGPYNFLFYGLAVRGFGRERIRQLFAELKEMLVSFGRGYRQSQPPT